jgi:Ca2+-binding EF-hand superfamily protein
MELMMTKYLLGSAAAAALIAIAPAAAQSGHAGHTAQAPRASAGQAPTRAQLGAHIATMFARLDTNRDGSITRAESEAAKGNRGDKNGQRQQRANRSPDQRGDNRAAMFDRLDANRDGSISRAEFAAAPARQDGRQARRSDRDADGGTARGARMRGGALGLRGHLFDMADANRDGRVTMAEATAAAYRHFDMADANRDGQITREERMQMHQRMRADRQPG